MLLHQAASMANGTQTMARTACLAISILHTGEGLSRTRVKDEAPEYHWWTRLPNIVLEKIKTPYQLALLFVYKKVAAEAGQCWFTMEKIAEMAKMSVGKASQTRRELEKLGLIKVELRKPKKGRGRPCCHVTMVNIWEENEAEWRRMCAGREGRLLPEEIFPSPDEEKERISSPHEGYPSPGEATKNKEENTSLFHREEKDPPSSKIRKRSRKRDPRLDHLALRIYRSLARLTVPHAVRDDLIHLFEEIGEKRYQAAVKTWIGKGWNPRNVLGIIDFARKESRGEASRRVSGKPGVSQAQREYYAAHLDPKD